MDIRLIRTEADYEMALQEIERLWDTKFGTPEGDKLDVLATLVAAFEEKHHPILPPEPAGSGQALSIAGRVDALH